MELAKTLQYLDECEDDFGNRTTSEVIGYVKEIVLEAQKLMASPFPYGNPCGEDDGGIRIEWFKQEKSVVLVFRLEHPSYIYVFDNSTKIGEKSESFSAQELAKQLDWLNQ